MSTEQPFATPSKLSYDLLYDQPVKGKKFTHPVSARLIEEQYDALLELVHHPHLSYDGDVSAAIRHAIDGLLLGCSNWLSPEKRSTVHRLRELREAVTRERYSQGFEEIVRDWGETIRRWLSQDFYEAAAESFHTLLGQIERIENPLWKKWAARCAVGNKDVLRLRKETEKQRGRTPYWSLLDQAEQDYMRMIELAGIEV